jgi:hypothetical protein
MVFMKMSCISRGKCCTLEIWIVILLGRRSDSDVSCCVFLANRIVRAASSGISMHKWRQSANSVAGVAFCEMCWKLAEASHETPILR